MGPRGCVIGVVTLLFLIFPSDTTWVNDEPALIHQALTNNSRRMLAGSGLQGTFGVPYGPLPVQIYQALLTVSHSPIFLICAHASLTAGATAVALLSLGRTLQLPLWYGVFLLFSPWQWIMSRGLWDNSFNISLGTVLLASYARFLADRKTVWLSLAIAAGVAMIFVHFMALPLVIAVFGHIAYQHSRALWSVRFFLIVLSLVVLLTQGLYVRQTIRLLGRERAAAVPAPFAVNVRSFFFPLRGGLVFSGEEFPLDSPDDSAWVRQSIRLAEAAALVAYPLVWAGIVIAALSCVSFRKSLSPGSKARETILCICIVTLVVQMLFYGLIGVMPGRHYFNATYVIFALFAWLAVASIRQRFAQVFTGALHGGAMIVMIGYLAIHMHLTGHFGLSLTLGVQRRVMYELAQYSNTMALTDVDHFKLWPHSLWALLELEKVGGGTIRAEDIWVHKSSPNSDDYQVVVETHPPPYDAEWAQLPLSGEIVAR